MGDKTAFRDTVGRSAGRIAGALLAGYLGQAGVAFAFPLVDPTNQDTLPGATDLAAPDAQDLQHQMDVSTGLSAGGGQGGWTILPRIGIEEALTDNILQLHSPRRWDLSTYISPGLAINGDTRRVQFRMDYAPVLIMNARTGSQNALNQQLNADGIVTVIDDLAFVDVRAVSGVQSVRGGIGGTGGIGAGDIRGITAGVGSSALTGLTRSDEIQTSSVGISPYLLHQFGDIGTAKIGYSLQLSQYSPVSGIKFIPFPTSGGSQHLVTNEQTAEFRTGDYFGALQDTLSVDFTQSTSSFQTSATPTGTTFIQNSSVSKRNFITNQVAYALSRSLSLNLSVGHEEITYGGGHRLSIIDMTWSVGATYSPSPRSSITLGYGHQQGENSISFSAFYQLTPRTSVTGSYTDTLGTQLENVQRQLNLGTVSAGGSFVNSTTGGPLFGATNALAVQPGIFHFRTLDLTTSTALDRDTLTLSLDMTDQVTAGVVVAGQFSSRSTSVVAQWERDLRPDLKLSTSLSYGVVSGSLGSSGKSIAFNTGLQYTINDSLSTSARYTYFKRDSQSSQFSLFENLFVLGLTKQF